MRSSRSRAVALFTVLLAAATLHADVKTDEKTLVKFEGMLGRVVNVFGGRAAREGVTSTVAVKGDRKATLNNTNGQIIDLNEEKIYDLDVRRKTYKVTTFAELRRQMEEARKKAEADAREQSRDQPQAEQTTPAPDAKEMEVDFDVKETGSTKAINGFDTRQFIITVALREKGKTLEQSGGLVLTADTWLAPTIAAMSEIAQFDLRYAQKLQGPMMSGASAQEMAAALAMHPGLQEGITRLRSESAKMDGTPIVTTITVDAVKSADQLAADQRQAESAQQPPASGGVGGLIGGLARRAARRNDEAPKPRVTFLTSTNEVLKVATTVADGDVAVPAGFKESR
jgi:hypothetical protein